MIRKLRYSLYALVLILTMTMVWQGISIKKTYKKSRLKQKSIEIQEEKPFVIIIPSYNNSAYCEKNLRSVLGQDYENYRVIYIDDCSQDDTFYKAQDLIEKSGRSARFTLIRNEKNLGALANFYGAIHKCKDQEIIVALDGDDFFAHDGVLTKLNRVYTKEDVWMTYGNYLDYPTYKQSVVKCKAIPKRVIRKNSFRRNPWVSSHLRTFYAALFKQIKLEDLLDQGDFFPMAGDLAMIYPLLEMAGNHSRFIPEILYLYNRSNPLNDHKKNFALQERCAQTIRKAKSYTPLKEFPQAACMQEVADCIVFSYDRPMQLFALLESAEKYMHSLNQISVLYRTSTQAFAEGYAVVQRAFPNVHFIRQTSSQEFAPLLHQLLYEMKSGYLLFAVDDILVKDAVDLQECIRFLKQTGAYGFYLPHGLHLNYCFMQDQTQQIPTHVSISKNIFAWQFKEGEADWNYANSLDMVLYRKEDVIKDLQTLTFQNPNTLETAWAKMKKKHKLGLFYTRSRTLNIPLNLVNISSNRHLNAYSTEELLQKFQQGLKIDISPFAQIENSSKHHCTEVSFISR